MVASFCNPEKEAQRILITDFRRGYERHSNYEREDLLPLALLNLYYGAFFFLLFLQFFTSGGISEGEEWKLFIFGWLVIPLSTLWLTHSIWRFSKKRLQSYALFFPFLLFHHNKSHMSQKNLGLVK